jgi:Family of unknown function (DUF6281)
VKPLRFAVGVTAVLAASGLLVGVASATSCADLLTWNGVRYDGAGGDLARQVRFGGEAGEAVIPVCNDEGSPGCQEAEGTNIPVFRLSGIDPQVAVGRERLGERSIWPPGIFPNSPTILCTTSSTDPLGARTNEPGGVAKLRFRISLARL